MAILTLDPPNRSTESPGYVHYGHVNAKPPFRSVLENGLRILVAIVLALLLTPLAVLSWKLCSNVLSDRVTRSVTNLELENWDQY